MAGRFVTLVLVDGHGRLLGQLPPFGVDTPWWQDLEPVVAACPAAVVLRLLDATPAPGQVMGGAVRYLAEVDRPPGLLQKVPDAEGLLADHPLRMPWARPGGPASDLEWAAAHVAISGPPVQVRSWNLSSIWRLNGPDGPTWLKCVPPFFGHEPDVLRILGPGPALPGLLAAEDHRMLLADMAGVDGYHAEVGDHRAIIDSLVEVQLSALGRLDQLAATVPDWRSPQLRAGAEAVVARRAADNRTLRRLLDDWDGRFQAIADCGIPEGLFHGDAHPGNARIGVEPPILFDWGDSGLGHPLLDAAVLSVHRAGDRADQVLRHWLKAWKRAVPGSDPDRAWGLIQPAAVLRGAVVFQRFLDHIEPSEHVYHHQDVQPSLDRATALACRK